MRTPRSTSRMSVGSKHGGSRASDEDGKTAVKVGMSTFLLSAPPPGRDRSGCASSIARRKSHSRTHTDDAPKDSM